MVSGYLSFSSRYCRIIGVGAAAISAMGERFYREGTLRASDADPPPVLPMARPPPGSAPCPGP